MNRRYMDFVPSQTTETQGTGRQRKVSSSTAVQVTERRVNGASSRVVTQTVRQQTRISSAAQGNGRQNVRMTTTKVVMRTPAKNTGSDAFSIKNEPELGVIEDLNPKFVNTNVAKRPLGSNTGESEIKEVKSKRLIGSKRILGGRAAKRAERAEKQARVAEKQARLSTEKQARVSAANQVRTGAKSTASGNGKYVVPKSPFINQNRVQKRPLSKNVYPKKIEETKPKKTGPVTIISKPEKEAHTSLIVTIILTIILGAAAGTVAFLLLPK